MGSKAPSLPDGGGRHQPGACPSSGPAPNRVAHLPAQESERGWLCPGAPVDAQHLLAGPVVQTLQMSKCFKCLSKCFISEREVATEYSLSP